MKVFVTYKKHREYEEVGYLVLLIFSFGIVNPDLFDQVEAHNQTGKGSSV